MNGTRHTGPAEPMIVIPSEARDAMLRAIAEYEPTAMAAIIASPAHLLSVLLEVSWRALGAAAPLIAAAERERLLSPSPGPRCCDPHGRNCEPPGELCCENCTEADHPAHRHQGPCSAPDLSPNTLAEARKIAVAVTAERERIAQVANLPELSRLAQRVTAGPDMSDWEGTWAARARQLAQRVVTFTAEMQARP